MTLCKYILCYVQYLQFKILQLKNQHYACKHEKVSNLRSSFQKCHKLFYLEYFITNSTAVPSPKYYCSVAYIISTTQGTQGPSNPSTRTQHFTGQRRMMDNLDLQNLTAKPLSPANPETANPVILPRHHCPHSLLPSSAILLWSEPL